MQDNARRYTFELWSIQGVKVADISHLAKNRKYTRTRNDAETLEFTLDLHAFEAFCASMNTPPRNVLFPYQTDVKVKRDGQYLFGVQVVAAPVSLGETESVVTVRCTGYLNLFKDRYVTKKYTQMDAAEIAGDLLMETQAQVYGDMGVTLDPDLYLTGVLRDREYTRDNVKDKVRALTSLIDGNFDIAIDSDKVFHTYANIGSLRNDLLFTYPGNIKSVEIERSAANLYNKIIGLGSGFGKEQVVADDVEGISRDNASILANYLREKIEQFNSVVEQDTLDQNTAARLEIYKNMLEIPKITVTGHEFNVSYINPGDRIPIKILGHSFIDNIEGNYRLEKMAVDLDDNDFESGITLYFDDLGVDQNEQAE